MKNPKKRILILEQRPAWRKQLTAFLHGDYELVVVSSVESALESSRSHSFDMVLSALHIDSNENVFDLLQDIRRRSPDLPFLFLCLAPSSLTKTIQHTLLESARTLGATDTLFADQIAQEQLLKKIGDILDQLR